eukprot:gene8242-11156_t
MDILYSDASNTDLQMNDITHQRPPTLTRLLDYQKARLLDCDELYRNFLLNADEAVTYSSTSKVDITAQFKIKNPLVKKVQTDYRNDNLIIVFNFYAAIIRRSFSRDFDFANDTMNIQELEIMCRDFNLTPKLLTHDDIKIIWTLASQDGVAQGKLPLVLLNFDSFKDMIIRMAVFAYHKPGMKNLVLHVEGFMPSTSGIVDAFCNFLHLSDIAWIRNFLGTVGKKTQGDINYKSKGDDNLRRQQQRRQDVNARKTSQYKSSKTSSNAILEDPFGESHKNPIFTAPASPDKVIRLSLKKKLLNSKSTPKISQRLAMPESLLAKLDYNSSKVMDPLPSINTNSNGTDDGNLLLESESELGFDFDLQSFKYQGDGQPSITSVPEVMEPTNSLSYMITSFRTNYDPYLVNQLSKYTYIQPMEVSINTTNSGGPYCDLGLVYGGSIVTIVMRVLNNSPDDIMVEGSLRDLQSDDATLSSLSTTVIPGFHRDLKITFSIRAQRTNVVGYCDIMIIAARDGVSSIINCPIFYRVDQTVEADTMIRCTKYTIDDLRAKYVDGNNRNKYVEFGTKKQNGTWTNTFRNNSLRTAKKLTFK